MLRAVCGPWRAVRPSFRDPGLVGNPVDLPGLAAVVGKRLLEVRRVRRDRGPDKSYVDHLAVVLLLVVELTDAILELTDHRLAQNSIVVVDPVNEPLVRSRAV